MLKAIIADDEQDAIDLLVNALNLCNLDLDILGIAKNIPDTEKLINKYRPDLVILDIQMPGGNVFEMLNNLKPISFDIIFITAYNQYAIQAIKHSAIDYLLKPIDVNDLKEAILKVEQKHKKEETVNDKIEKLLYNFENQQNKIAIVTNDKVSYLKLSEIIRLEGEGNYVRFITTNNENYFIAKRIIEFQNILTFPPFFRIHNSYLINVDYVKSLLSKELGIIMTDNTLIPISRKKKEEFYHIMENYIKKSM